MDFNLFLVIVAAAAIFTLLATKIFYMVYGKFKAQEDKSIASSSSSPPSSLPRNWIHDLFPSFHGADVRRSFLSHIMKEFRSKGINPFVDNEIKRGEFIGPELKTAIQESKIAVVLLSKNYASSSWCLDELVEIMRCKEDLGQTVVAIFYEVDPTDVKKQTRDFGKAFAKTCKGKANEVIEKWRGALEKVATVAGYHSKNWDDEATMIEDIASHISNMLNVAIPPSVFNGLIGMEDHMRMIKPLLRLDLEEEVRMIGIWGPLGIGKSTIARCLFNQHSGKFPLGAIMVDIKGSYQRSCLDEGSAQLQLQSQMLTKMLNHKEDIVIHHLGVAQERLKNKKVFLVLDDVDRSAQLVALAKETGWFGPGSRIIITTENLRVLKAHGIDNIYKVDFPTNDQAFQMFCMYAFDQKCPKDGFEDLAQEVTKFASKLPLGLKFMGSYFRGRSMEEWENALPNLRRSLDGEIESILRFSYDALSEDDKYLFLHIACFFNHEKVKKVVEYLKKTFPDVRHRLDVLVEKSLIDMEYQRIEMHSLLVKLGEDIVRNKSIHDPGQRQFLVDDGEICDVLMDDEAGSRSVIGINYKCYAKESEKNLSEKSFKKMSNLQFLKLEGPRAGFGESRRTGPPLRLSDGLSYLSSQLRLLHWPFSPMTCFPSNFDPKFLVEIEMSCSKLEKLWEGNKLLKNLRWMDLRWSTNLKELPNLSTATKLQKLDLSFCSSLVELPCSIGSATDLQVLNLGYCRNLVQLPTSIGNLHKLSSLTLRECSKLEVLPVNINLKSLDELDLSGCSSLKSFPEISTNVSFLSLSETAIEEVPPSVKGFSRLRDLILSGCKKLVSLAQLPDSLEKLNAENCESLERIDFSFHIPTGLVPNFDNCFKLNKEARDVIIQSSKRGITGLPGKEIPSYFTHRGNGGSLVVELDERSFPSSLIFRACVLLVENKDCSPKQNFYCKYGIKSDEDEEHIVWNNSCFRLYGPKMEHLYIFDFKEAYVARNEIVFKFWFNRDKWVIKECGVHITNTSAKKKKNEGESVDDEEEEIECET